MKFSIAKIRPDIEFGVYDDLPKDGGLLKAKRHLLVPGDQIAFVAKKGGVKDIFPASAEEEVKLEIKKGESYLSLPRNISVDIEARDLFFRNNVKGMVGLSAGIRFLKADNSVHPVMGASSGELSREKMQGAIENILEAIIGSILGTVLCQVDYSPGMASAELKDVLNANEHIKAIKEQLYRKKLGLHDDIVVKRIQSEEADGKREKKKRRQEETQTALEDIANDAVVGTAKSEGERKKKNAEHRLEIDNKQAKIVLAELEREEKTVLATTEIEDAIKEERLLESELSKRKNEALTNEEIEREKIKTEKERALAAREVEQKKKDLEILMNESRLRMEKLELALEESKRNEQKIKEVENSIALSAVWKVYDNQRQLVQSNLRSGSRLESANKLLRTEVTVNRDAYVYILLYNSENEWQRLVPESGTLSDGRRLGIARDNRQKAGKPCLWPPSEIDVPFWGLDNTPGIENLIVIASIEPLDIGEMMSSKEMNELKESFASVGTRGFCSPNVSENVGGADYNSVYEEVTGSGAVVEEMVIEHI